MSAPVLAFRNTKPKRHRASARPFVLQGSGRSNSELYDGLVTMSRLRAVSPEVFAAILKMANKCVTDLEEERTAE